MIFTNRLVFLTLNDESIEHYEEFLDCLIILSIFIFTNSRLIFFFCCIAILLRNHISSVCGFIGSIVTTINSIILPIVFFHYLSQHSETSQDMDYSQKNESDTELVSSSYYLKKLQKMLHILMVFLAIIVIVNGIIMTL